MEQGSRIDEHESAYGGSACYSLPAYPPLLHVSRETTLLWHFVI